MYCRGKIQVASPDLGVGFLALASKSCTVLACQWYLQFFSSWLIVSLELQTIKDLGVRQLQGYGGGHLCGSANKQASCFANR